jgi:hypothetical protein
MLTSTTAVNLQTTRGHSSSAYLPDPVARRRVLIVRFQGEADKGRHMVPIISAASDPKRT